MFQTWNNIQLLRRVLWISAELTIVSSLKHKNTQPLYIFNRVRVLHLNRLKERTWLHSFVIFCSDSDGFTKLEFQIYNWGQNRQRSANNCLCKKYLVAALKKTKKFCETNLRKHTVSSLQMRWFPQILDIYVFGRFGNDEVWMLKTEYR